MPDYRRWHLVRGRASLIENSRRSVSEAQLLSVANSLANEIGPYIISQSARFMPIRIEVLPQYVHVSWYGTLAEQDLDQLSAEMPKIGVQLGKAPNVLHTYDEVEGMGLPPESLQAHARRLGRTKVPNRCRAATVCSNPLAYGMARMMQMLNRNPDIQIEVFSGREEALCWLKAPLS